MLLQTNSYIVPKDKRAQHARLVHRFRQTLTRLGCAHFEAYEQVGANWSPADTSGRFVQLMRFADRKQQLAVQAAERNDATAQALIKEFCELINFPYQQQQGLFAVGFYHSLLPNQTPGTAGATGDDAAEDDDSVKEVSQENHSPEPGEPPTASSATPVPAAPHAAEELDVDDFLGEEHEGGQAGDGDGDGDGESLLDHEVHGEADDEIELKEDRR